MQRLKKWCLLTTEGDHKSKFVCNRCVKVKDSKSHNKLIRNSEFASIESFSRIMKTNSMISVWLVATSTLVPFAGVKNLCVCFSEDCLLRTLISGIILDLNLLVFKFPCHYQKLKFFFE